MTFKPFLGLIAGGLLLGSAVAPAVAELVPGAQWPNIGVPVLLGQPHPEPAEPAPPAKKDGPAALEHGWEGGPSRDRDGKFAYCVIEGQYDTGHALMMARNTKGELNIGIGIPGADLPKDEEWLVKIVVDGKVTRERVAVAPQRDMLVIANGKDEALFNALMSGNELLVTSSADRIAFTLRGTKKALGDLAACVEKKGEVPPFKPAVVSAKSKSGAALGLPAPLVGLLNAAGLEEIEPVGFGSTPVEQRPADFAWRYGPIFGGVRERAVGEGAKITDLSDSFTDVMRKRCEGEAAVTFKDTEDLPDVSLRIGTVDCKTKQGALHVSLLFFLPADRLFTVIFHEAGERDRELADQATDNLARVIRKVATQP